MKNVYIIMGLSLFIIACNKVDDKENESIKPTLSTTTVSFEPPKLEQNILEKLYADQMQIIKNPASRPHKEKYISGTYFPEKNTLISFGNARLTNPQTGAKISAAMSKRAALLDAKRWASYGLLWLSNDFQPDFGKINETNQGEIKQLATFNKGGDSLIIAIASKIK